MMSMICKRQLSHSVCVLVVGTIMLLLVNSCTSSDDQSQLHTGKVLARVFDFKLYDSDLRDVIPDGITSEDSARRIKLFINSWVKEKLLVHKAEANLGKNPKNMEKQLADYKNSLIIYAYEKELVRQRLDTIVSDAMIQEYYNVHPKDFELKDNILKVVYVKVNKKVPNLTKLRTLIKSDKPKDKTELEVYCKQFGQNYFLDDNVWLLFEDLLKEVPIETYNKELFLQNNRFIELADSASFYFVNIKGFMTRNSHSPLSFERENIRSIIINKRKREMVDQMHKDLYQDAIENKDIEIYSN